MVGSGGHEQMLAEKQPKIRFRTQFQLGQNMRAQYKIRLLSNPEVVEKQQTQRKNKKKYSRDQGWSRRPFPNAGRKKKKNAQKSLFFVKKIKLRQQKYVFFNFNFFTKKNRFSGIFSSFYGQHSVTAAWTTPSPWSISFPNTKIKLIQKKTT